MAVFFIFSIFLGAVLQLTNAFGDTFLHSFEGMAQYKDCVAVKYPAIIMSISQMSETCFIITIPFFLRHFEIKKAMMMSMFAWVFRFGLFGVGDPAGGLWMIVLSCIIYGMAFDFFNILGSIYTELNAHPSIRASAQGLFVFMTNGLGCFFGSIIAGIMISAFYTDVGDVIRWQGWNGVWIWILFASYALVVGILFTIMCSSINIILKKCKMFIINSEFSNYSLIYCI